MRSRAARRIAPGVIPRLHLALFHLTDGRIHLSAALVPSLVLHTEGARTGARRETPLMYSPEPDGSMLVVGSNFARPEHPAWTSNLLAHPDAQVSIRRRRYRVQARLLDGAELEAAWLRLDRVWPGYRGYEVVAGRSLRVFRLTLAVDDPSGALPDQAGRRVVVTGGNAGLGYFAVERMAAAGASVVIAARNPDRAEAAARSVRSRVPGASVSIVRLDLADLASVERAAAVLSAEPIDVLVANAGLLPQLRRRATADGFELVFGTNYLGHFALIGRLMPTLLTTEGARIVHLGSISHRGATLDFADLSGSRRRVLRPYHPYRAYSRSKLAVMLFGFELDRRLRAAGASTGSLVADPGYATDALTPPRAGIVRRSNPLFRFVVGFIGQGKDAGALPVVYAACAGQGGDYWATERRLRGRPRLTQPGANAVDRLAADLLWRASEVLTGVSFAVLDPGQAHPRGG
jgi:deazaflavin-dependent oxidoreductase (nitroreductase family)